MNLLYLKALNRNDITPILKIKLRFNKQPRMKEHNTFGMKNEQGSVSKHKNRTGSLRVNPPFWHECHSIGVAKGLLSLFNQRKSAAEHAKILIGSLKLPLVLNCMF